MAKKRILEWHEIKNGTSADTVSADKNLDIDSRIRQINYEIYKLEKEKEKLQNKKKYL
jgi:hypothetical protein